MPVRPEAFGFTSNLHGGAIATLVDLSCALAAARASGFDPTRESLVTADMHVRYLGRPGTDRVTARVRDRPSRLAADRDRLQGRRRRRARDRGRRLLDDAGAAAPTARPVDHRRAGRPRALSTGRGRPPGDGPGGRRQVPGRGSVRAVGPRPGAGSVVAAVTGVVVVSVVVAATVARAVVAAGAVVTVVARPRRGRHGRCDRRGRRWSGSAPRPARSSPWASRRDRRPSCCRRATLGATVTDPDPGRAVLDLDLDVDAPPVGVEEAHVDLTGARLGAHREAGGRRRGRPGRGRRPR